MLSSRRSLTLLTLTFVLAGGCGAGPDAPPPGDVLVLSGGTVIESTGPFARSAASIWTRKNVIQFSDIEQHAMNHDIDGDALVA